MKTQIFHNLKVTQGHKRPLLWQNHSRIFVYGPILVKICMKTQFWPGMSLLCYGEVPYFFTLRPSDLITTLTYVLMDNLCAYFLYDQKANLCFVLNCYIFTNYIFFFIKLRHPSWFRLYLNYLSVIGKWYWIKSISTGGYKQYKARLWSWYIISLKLQVTTIQIQIIKKCKNRNFYFVISIQNNHFKVCVENSNLWNFEI